MAASTGKCQTCSMDVPLYQFTTGAMLTAVHWDAASPQFRCEGSNTYPADELPQADRIVQARRLKLGDKVRNAASGDVWAITGLQQWRDDDADGALPERMLLEAREVETGNRAHWNVAGNTQMTVVR